MNHTRLLITFLTCTLMLTACSIIHGAKATPIPEKPISEMSTQPAKGIAGANSIGDAYIPELGNTGYDVQQYNLDMEFSSQLDFITATVTISSMVTLDDLGRISLDFTGNQVDSVQVGKRYASFYREPDKLYIDLPKAYAKGKELVVSVFYHGAIKPHYSSFSPMMFAGLIKPEEDENYAFAFAEPDGAHFWFPCNDHPLDKAAYRFELKVPKGLTAIANGQLLGTIQSDTQDTFVWVESAPMASYLSMVAVGDYQLIDALPAGNVKVNYYLRTVDSDYSKKLSETQAILKYYSEMIGPYPFDQLGITVVDINDPEKSFAMESQTMMMFEKQVMDAPNIEFTLAHEIVHQWFGDNLSLNSWGEVWLKEGLATYMAFLWLEQRGIIDLQDGLTDFEKEVLSYGGTQSLNQPPANDMYGANTYLKGAWVFHLLRLELGDQVFFRFVRQYYERYAGGNSTTAGLQQVAEELSGKDLDGFFNQWVYGEGNPRLHLSWMKQPDGVTVQVCQTSWKQDFAFPLEIQLTGTLGVSETRVIQVGSGQQRVSYSLPFTVTQIVADPDQKVLAFSPVAKVEQLEECGP